LPIHASHPQCTLSVSLLFHVKQIPLQGLFGLLSDLGGLWSSLRFKLPLQVFKLGTEVSQLWLCFLVLGLQLLILLGEN
jgi:hypothetical protein